MIEKNKKYKVPALKIILLLIITLSSNLFAQDYIFKQLKIEDGLSQSTIFASLQDNKGYLWFATRSGLNRYDGYEFRVYYNDPKDSTSLSDDGTNSLYEDKSGTLWIGTIYGNINRFDRRTETFYYKNVSELIKTIPEQNDDFFEYPLSFSRNQSTTITCITEDSKGFLWIGTWGKGILQIDKNFKRINHFYAGSDGGLKTNRIMDLQFDDNGRLWVATFGGGLTRITKSINDSKEIYTFENIMEGKDQYSLTDNKLLTLYQDSEKNIWIGSYYGGLMLIDSDQVSLPFGKLIANGKRCPVSGAELRRNTIIAITEDNNKNIWLGTFGGGLIRYNKNKNETIHFFNDPFNENSLGDNDVLSLCTDRSGIIWAGSHLGAGITKIMINNNRFNLIKHNARSNNTLNDNVVWAIYKDNYNHLWIGTYKGGINIYNTDTKQFSSITKTQKNNPISSNHIRVIKEDNFGNLWVGTYDGGLNIINKKTKQVKVYKNSQGDFTSIGGNQIQDIYIDSDSVYWIGTFGGGLNKVVCKGNPFNQSLKFKAYKSDKVKKNTISDNRVYKIYPAENGNFWIGTYGGGLNKFFPASGTFERFPINSGIEDKFNIENIMTIHKDYEGTLWIGSYGGSLTSFNEKSAKFKRYSFKEGISSGVVYGILEDNKNLWISSDNGLFKFDLISKDVKRFDIKDGLQSLEFSGGAYIKDSNGTLYFGGINGLNFFNPKEIKPNTYIPQVVITSINVLNEHYKGEPEEIVLTHKKNFISFEFSSLDYSDPQDNQYSYILEGLQTDWQISEPNSRVATYTNLAPGKYVFKVRGSNSDGVWSDNYESIRINILYPFWQTWWFITSSIILLALFVYYLSTLRIKNQLAIEKLKSKLAADLHDNIGSGLTEISILSEVASRKVNLAGGNELNKISDISRRLVDNMSDIVWVVNPKRDSLHDLILRLKDSYADLLSSMGISFKAKDLEKLKDVKLPMDVKQNLYLIFKEAINNSLKHSHCKHIILETNLRNDILEISVTDDGKGFLISEQDSYSGNGLKNIENRARQIGGKIKIKSSPESGTSVRFIGKANYSNKLFLMLNK